MKRLPIGTKCTFIQYNGMPGIQYIVRKIRRDGYECSHIDDLNICRVILDWITTPVMNHLEEDFNHEFPPSNKFLNNFK